MDDWLDILPNKSATFLQIGNCFQVAFSKRTLTSGEIKLHEITDSLKKVKPRMDSNSSKPSSAYIRT